MSSTTAIHSNAFNFMSYVQHGVDPRTGQYTVSLALPDVKSHALAGPALPLTLAFSPMNVGDAGFGVGWGINLTSYNTRTWILSVGTGETFKVTSSGPTPELAEKKLDSFHFHVDGGGRFRVVHRSGLVEVLQEMGSDGVALPVDVIGADGRTLKLAYTSFGSAFRLRSVSDDSSELLRIERDTITEQVHLDFYPEKGEGGGALARFVLHLDGASRVTKVGLPVEEACWRLAYKSIRGMSCLEDVWTPAGAHETLTYGDDGHLFPSAAHPALPRVTRHVIDPGFEQPPMEVHYTYSNANFLGNGALNSWKDDGLDNLYNVADDTFRYWSKASHWLAGKPCREVKRDYNRFHLMVEEATTQGICRKRVVTVYPSDLPENRHKPFAQQPANCQLPLRVTTHWELTNDSTAHRSESVTTQFDDDGNLVEQINADGTREVREYYPAEGEGSLCPPDPENFRRILKSSTVYPATSAYGSAPTLRTEFTYRKLDSIPWSHSSYFVGEATEVLREPGQAELKRVETEYYDSSADTLRLGREKSVTETLNGKSTVVDHSYEVLDSSDVAQSVLQVVETITGFDGSHRRVTQEQSLLNGEPLLVEDEDGVKIRYVYDSLARVVQETVAPDTVYEATRHYTYHLVGESADDHAWQQMTDVKQVSTRTWLDGQARPVKEERQDADAAQEQGLDPREAAMRLTFQAKYDELGQLVSETESDWLGNESRALETGFAYDDWGEQISTTRPDKVVEWNVLDPLGSDEAPGPIRTQWLESTEGVAGGRTVTWIDLFGEPVHIERFDAAGTSVSVVLNHPDGLGRVAESVDARDMTTKYTYDAFGRVLDTTLPGNAVVARRYAQHSVEDLPESISVNGTVLGTQTFDGLDRLVESVTGGRQRTLHYTAGDARPCKVITPASNEIQYEYLPQLGEEITVRTLPGGAASYTYDNQNALLTHCSEQGIGLEREYYSNGELKKETRKVAGREDEIVECAYSLKGRFMQWSMGDVRHRTTYDAIGRPHTAVGVGIASTFTEFKYDTFGRVEWIIVSEPAEQLKLQTQICYDDFGREVMRCFTSPQGNRTLELTYDAADALETRTLTQGETVVRAESFFYDVRSRLQRHEISGTELPMDPDGKAYTRQVFVADALDNITNCMTEYADGGRLTARYQFEGEDPCQLSSISRELQRSADSAPDAPVVEELEYDADGNLTRDEQGRTLLYDPLGRLTGVEALGGLAEATYRFDALDVLAERVSGSGTERRFYVDDTLVARVQDNQRCAYLRGGGHLLAEQVEGDEPGTILLATDLSNTVLGEVRPGDEQHVAYTAYGFPYRGPRWTEIGYNGELHETDGRWQLLGNGYRAFNPLLLRFQSPDDVSPFDVGGLNAYSYCGNDPANHLDPSGHWMMGAGAIALGLGAATAVGGADFCQGPP
ncbi:RHS repeat-associated core domain-containing protein [Stenotrophomonas sp. 278]|uniref:RHS repeat domain-containing protein n=1 Tax=Stenotrophomonas sp. 278 TaxID=2479851 RepID=UPI000F65E0FB|nr:RHS repeat-associated core domain-containing protein [Stenotrophomonas sp. 278]RRU23522.1 sugar-binding protein [Stenotrophomonas sp. 278]